MWLSAKFTSAWAARSSWMTSVWFMPAATANGVIPVLSVAFTCREAGEGRCCSSSWTIAVLPLWAARYTALCPLGDFRSTGAPAARSRWAISTWPMLAATSRGVRPALSSLSTFAPLAIRYSTMGSWALATAACSSVCCVGPCRALTFAPWATSCFAICRCPAAATPARAQVTCRGGGENRRNSVTRSVWPFMAAMKSGGGCKPRNSSSCLGPF
mmetsp:Transcript_13490/g.24089  ORF Transcript_13490/g.24089 Transcript_13490/m.24089 type:complete len:214 (+) Transcript_13490:1963-2604(+)